jgi:uncharacterized MnhB-related membrane protein
MDIGIAIGAAVIGGILARTWYMAVVLGTILGVAARFAYVWFRTGSVARWEFDAAIVGTIVGCAVAALLAHLLMWWWQRR